jgi:hypothetical protein
MDDAKWPLSNDSGGGAGHWRRTVIYYRTGQKPIPRLVCVGVELSHAANGKIAA